MDFENREGRSIQSLDDWEHLGKPASSDHWKPGRSAYELARDWIDGDAADAVTALLSSRHEFSGIALIDAVAEKRTRFDGDSHGPRNHDLLVRAAMPSGNPVTVAIEGKADEAFDAPLWQYREKALRRSKDTGALLRIDALVHRWFGTSLAADRAEPPLICLGYQLFSALAGTLADAKQHGSQLAVVLIMEYVTNLTDDAKHADNARMLDHFLERLIGRGAERTCGPGGWITKPTGISGDGTWSALKTDVAFGKLVRERRNDTQS